jgi:hypothetical protein
MSYHQEEKEQTKANIKKSEIYQFTNLENNDESPRSLGVMKIP